MAESKLPLCDLVMKGGITSGIVYPPAILELQKTYKFHSIGGTSAGAIAAAGTAAAEFNRQGGGFDRLQDVRTWLGQDDHLRNLFQASPDTQPLLDILYAATERPSTTAPKIPLFLRLVQRLVPSLTPPVLIIASSIMQKWGSSNKAFRAGGRTGMGAGILISIILAIISSLVVMGIAALFGGTHNLWLLWVSLLCFILLYGLSIGWLGLWIGRLFAALIDLLDLITKRIPQNNFYGVCTGHSDQPDGTNLTDWLSDIIDHMAGLPAQTSPLTFEQLSHQKISLKMMTSNLSHGQPYILPEGLKNFIYKEDELARFFPAYVAQHILNATSHDTLVPPGILPKGYHFLPDAGQLPVVFGARLSLSFPLLLSAVPLYTIKTTSYSAWSNNQDTIAQLTEKDLQTNWFSDGGICSNFPIQFFDAWLPSHPTFGINLTDLRGETSRLNGRDGQTKSKAAIAQATGQTVYLPPAEDRPDPEWTKIDQLIPFLGAIFGTAQNYRDTMQANLPSYRERIAQIRLDKNEGGLHLTMPPEIIQRIVNKGTTAGQMLSDPTIFDFNHHWWVRFLVLMAQLEENIEGLERSLTNVPDIAERLQREFSDLQSYPYCRDELWCNEAALRMNDLQTLIVNWERANQRWGKPSFFRADPPMPYPVLRVMPPV